MSKLERQSLVGKYRNYSTYRNSGVDWIGEMPAVWTLKRVKHMFTVRKRIAGELGYDILSVTQRGIVVKDIESGEGQLSMDYSKYQRVKPGDFAMNHMDLLTGYVDISDYDGVTSPDYRVFTLDNTDYFAKYFLYIFQMGYQLRLFFHMGQGASHLGRWRLATDEFNEMVFPVPSCEEQRTIAAFLDYETARIDLLITQQQRLIELLKEKRQAVISHAVTKGLNPDAPMKDSGIEWLGQVPKHWVVSPLKYKCEFSGGGTPSKDNLEYWNGSIPWVSPKDMKSFWITDAEDKITEQAIKESSTKLVQPGAVLMVVRSGILQRTIPVGINTIPVTMNQDMKAIRFSSAVYAEWLSFFIKGYEDSLLLDWRKQGATVESIEHEYLANSLMLFPPEEEARSIIAALGRRLDKFDQLEQRASDAITLLQERRTALISAAVTGKIDLRGWTPSAEEATA
ncbi:restriction endonuclease subunit S [Aeromonas dhakensis]|uniref:restriction endonuclease subunit S n=1 Tax=Aeromonas TaxID=642 RepID=UPI003BA21E95